MARHDLDGTAQPESWSGLNPAIVSQPSSSVDQANHPWDPDMRQQFENFPELPTLLSQKEAGRAEAGRGEAGRGQTVPTSGRGPVRWEAPQAAI